MPRRECFAGVCLRARARCDYKDRADKDREDKEDRRDERARDARRTGSLHRSLRNADCTLRRRKKIRRKSDRFFFFFFYDKMRLDAIVPLIARRIAFRSRSMFLLGGLLMNSYGKRSLDTPTVL